MIKALSFMALFNFGLVPPARAAVLEGVDFPEKTKVAGHELVLNGVGLRTATMFKVRVYAAGLYVAAKSRSAPELLARPTPKQLRMVFLRDVDAEDMQKAWAKTFESNCAQNCDALQPALKELQALMQPLKKGDSQVYTFEKDAVLLAINGQAKGKVSGEPVAKFLLSTWLGEHPPSEGLRDGLLGL
jgi:hypothetical protein